MPRSLVLAVLLSLPALRPAHAQRPVDQLSWLAGCHELQAGDRIVHESWMRPLGGAMLGMSRTVVRGTMREFEQLRIVEEQGVPVYIARPMGQPETSFKASMVSDTLVRFENPTHDFPQRIQYRRAGTDSVVARIEGNSGRRVRGIEFPMRRVACR